MVVKLPVPSCRTRTTAPRTGMAVRIPTKPARTSANHVVFLFIVENRTVGGGTTRARVLLCDNVRDPRELIKLGVKHNSAGGHDATVVVNQVFRLTAPK